ncbi:uncharacterized protein LOC142331299 [Lycorma delicatula]|uniref:uncharacterized protein LOC142331299 n=1 Tax=Lycorma delicatula TaxID=130591 RepID=UPI003F512C21
MASVSAVAVALLIIGVISGEMINLAAYEYGRYPVNNYYEPRAPVAPLAILADSPYSIAKTSVDVPLVIVPQQTLHMINNPHIKAVSPIKPLVTCQTQQYVMDATPAVKVVLKKPLYIETPASTIPFPPYMSILHEGLRMNIPVGMVIAPVPEYGFTGPHLIRIIYAIPTSPLPLQYPYFESYNYRQPEVPVVSFSSLRPVPQHTEMNYIPEMKKPPLITVLNFPAAVATPESLYYQPPIDSEDELGNRGPPEALPPSGIVQSTAPQANLQAFLNSKESPELQALRDEAEKNKNNSGAQSGVEAL